MCYKRRLLTSFLAHESPAPKSFTSDTPFHFLLSLKVEDTVHFCLPFITNVNITSNNSKLLSSVRRRKRRKESQNVGCCCSGPGCCHYSYRCCYVSTRNFTPSLFRAIIPGALPTLSCRRPARRLRPYLPHQHFWPHRRLIRLI